MSWGTTVQPSIQAILMPPAFVSPEQDLFTDAAWTSPTIHAFIEGGLLLRVKRRLAFKINM